MVMPPVQPTREVTSSDPEPVPQIPPSKRRGVTLQSVTLRFPPSVVRSLRKAACERSVDYEEPFTQQDIAEVAIRGWLEDHGYLAEEAPPR